MAPTQRASARAQRLTSLVAVALVAVAVAASFGRVFQGRPATLRLLMLALLSSSIAWALERRSLLLATAASGVLLVVSLGLLVFPDTLRYLLPTLETLRQAAEAAAQVGSEARARVSPAEPVVPLVFAAATAVWAATFSCHSLAFRAGSPLLALVPPAALVAFADSVLDGVSEPLYGLLFLAAALAVVFADSLRRIQGWGPIWTSPGARGRFLPAAGRGGRRIAVATLAVASLAPFVVPGYGSKAVIDLSSSGGDGLINVSPLVSIGSELTRGEPREVFTVQSKVRSYWRMTALQSFDGVTWQMSDEGSAEVSSGGSLGEPANPERIEAKFIASNDLGFPWLPAPYHPDGIEYNGTVSWASRSQTLTAGEPLRQGESYVVTASFPSPSDQDLRAEKVFDPSQYPELYAELVGLPPDVPPEIGQLAAEWTAGAHTTYDRVIAIQRHLTDPAQFRYSTEVSFADDSRTLVDFLTATRTGFCQQFASAMAVMLRSLGIPARVAVGFTPGTSPQDGIYRVTTDNLHAWVEVLFPTYGWLAFEPTPGRANPAAATYMPTGSDREPEDPRCIPPTPKCQGGQPGTITRPTPRIEPEPGRAAEGGATGAEPGRSATGIVTASLAALLTLALAGVPLLRRARRKRRAHISSGDPRGRILATYHSFLGSTADLGIGRRAGETPSEYAARVRQSGRLSDGHLDRLTLLAIRSAYSASEPSREEALDAQADAEEALEDLRAGTPLIDRLVGAYGIRRK